MLADIGTGPVFFADVDIHPANHKSISVSTPVHLTGPSHIDAAVADRTYEQDRMSFEPFVSNGVDR